MLCLRIAVVLALSALSLAARAAVGTAWQGVCYDSAQSAASAQCASFGNVLDTTTAGGPYIWSCGSAGVIGTSSRLSLRRNLVGSTTIVTFIADTPVYACDTVTAQSLGVNGWLSAIAGVGLLMVLMHGWTVGRSST